MELTFEVTLTYPRDNEPTAHDPAPDPDDLHGWILDGFNESDFTKPPIISVERSR